MAYDRRRRMDSDHVNVLAPLEIALAVTAAHLFLLPYTWCSINPARSFGSAVIGARWTSHWIWWVAPIIAGIGGPLLYESCFKHFYSGAAERAAATKRRQAREVGVGQEREGAGFGTTGVAPYKEREREGAGYTTGVTSYK